MPRTARRWIDSLRRRVRPLRAKGAPRPTMTLRSAPMSVALGLVLGFFVLVAVTGVIGVATWTGYVSATDQIDRRARLLLASVEAQARQHLDAAERQTEFLADQISSGEATPGASEEFTSLLTGALAPVPQVLGVLYVDADHDVVGVRRTEDGTMPLFLRAGHDDDIVHAVQAARGSQDGLWLDVVWRADFGEALLCFVQPLRDGGRFTGALISLVSVTGLSEFIAELDPGLGDNAFILYGRDEILAHPMMAYGYPGLTASNPLPRRRSFSDPVLVSMWDEEAEALPGIEGAIDGQLVSLGEASYGVLYREIDGYSEPGGPGLTIGSYFHAHDLYAEILRLKWAVLACLGILLASVAVAAIIGRQVSAPVRRLAEGARRIRALDFANVPRVPDSLFSEISEAARCFNGMLDGMGWFERYVPKPLVRQLMRAQAGDSLEPCQKVVTVMFTDIVGFTALTETMPPAEVAELLNGHFSMIAAAVEADGGMVDKYIGDSVMAVWGATDDDPGTAESASRAALAISAAIEADNRSRRQAGEPVIRLRIGIHTGPAVVGNIGGAERINYTVIGDTVNTANRLDEIGKAEWTGACDTRVLMSGRTAWDLGPGFDLERLGARQVRGRNGELDVFALRTCDRRELREVA